MPIPHRDRKTFLGSAPALLISIWVMGFWTHEAYARPGTPTEVTAHAGGAIIRFGFRNTASEAVVFDVELAANGQPVWPHLITCEPAPGLHTDCEHLYIGYPGYFRTGRPVQLRGQSLLLSGKFAYDTDYCYRVRARDWNNGNPGAGHVSELWSGWVCVTSGSIPAPPARPLPPRLKYVAPVPERKLPAEVEISGDHYQPIFNCKRLLTQLWTEVEWNYPNALSAATGWNRVDQLGVRTGPRRQSSCDGGGWPIVHDYGAENLPRYMSVAPGDPLAYRVCSVNDGGRTCSSPTRVVPSAAQALLPPGVDRAKLGAIGAPSVQSVVPSSYTRSLGQPPAHVDVQLTFAGGGPTRARYSIDDGLRTGWLEATQLTVNGNVALVRVPYDPFQQATQQVHIKLSNNVGESIGTIAVLAGTANQGQALKPGPIPSNAPPPPAPRTAPSRAPVR